MAATVMAATDPAADPAVPEGTANGSEGAAQTPQSSTPPSSFKLSKDAAEFVPQSPLPKTSFQFNPGACEFKPTTAPKSHGGKGAGKGQEAQQVQSGLVGLQPIQMVAAPMGMSPGGCAFPIVCLPNGAAGYAVAGPMLNMGSPTGATVNGPMGVFHAPQGYNRQDGSNMMGQAEGRSKGGGKGGQHRGHQGGHRDVQGRGQNWHGQGRRSGSFNNGGAGMQGDGYGAHSGYGGMTKVHSPELAVRKEEEERMQKDQEEEKKEEEPDEEKEKADEKKDPNKKSWADIARESMKKPAASPVAAEAKAMPKRVQKKVPSTATAPSLTPKSVSWGPPPQEGAAEPVENSTATTAPPAASEEHPEHDDGGGAHVDVATAGVPLAEGNWQFPASPAAGSCDGQQPDVAQTCLPAQAENRPETQKPAPASNRIATPPVGPEPAAAPMSAPQTPPSLAAATEQSPDAAAAAPIVQTTESPGEPRPTPGKPKEAPSWADRLFKNSGPSPSAAQQPKTLGPLPVKAPRASTRVAKPAAAPAAAEAPELLPPVGVAAVQTPGATEPTGLASEASTADDAAGKDGAGPGPRPRRGGELHIETEEDDEVSEAMHGEEGGPDAGAGDALLRGKIAEEDEGLTEENLEAPEEDEDEEEEDEEDQETWEQAAKNEDDEEAAPARKVTQKGVVAGGGADSGAGVNCNGSTMLTYSISFLKSLANAPGSTGSCPPSIPTVLRNDSTEDAEPENGKRCKMEYLKQCKDKPASQDMRIGATPPESPKVDAGRKEQRPAATEKAVDDEEGRSERARARTGEGRDHAAKAQDDWRAQQVKHQAHMKAHRDKDNRGRRSGGGGGRAHRHEQQDEVQRLTSSDKSWVIQQKQRKEDEDESVIRQMKSILNKLTVEKFDTLYTQLLDCGIRSTVHVECLMREVFEKATTQHHFIEMYTGLCVKLNEHFNQGNFFCGEEDGDKEQKEKNSFKRILLNECQDSFEKYLKPPEGLEEDGFSEAFVKYKTKMLGNMRFVAQLLINKMLSSKIIIQCIDELIFAGTDEAWETLATFLGCIGPSFDVEGGKFHDQFNKYFYKVREFCEDPDITPRIRCLLQDVIDLRKSGWKKKGVHSEVEGPKRMAEVRSQWEKDNVEKDKRTTAPPTPSAADGDWEMVGKARLQRATTGPERPRGPMTPQGDMRRTISGGSNLGRDRRGANSTAETPRAGAPKFGGRETEWRKMKSDGTYPAKEVNGNDRKGSKESKVASVRGSLTAAAIEAKVLAPGTSLAPQTPSSTSAATTERVRREVLGTLTELAASHDLSGAVTRCREAGPFPKRKEEQAALIKDIVSEAVQKPPSSHVVLWQFLARLVSEQFLQRLALAEGCERFIDECFADLVLDVPGLGGFLDEALAVLEATFTSSELARLRDRAKGACVDGSDAA